MKIMTIQVPDDSVEFVERIDGKEKEEEKQEEPIKKARKKSRKRKLTIPICLANGKTLT